MRFLICIGICLIIASNGFRTTRLIPQHRVSNLILNVATAGVTPNIEEEYNNAGEPVSRESMNKNVTDSLLLGRWVERSENYILLPVDDDGVEVPPVGVIHFLGGAFVGAAPHITYRYLLESLNKAGFIIVATPYRLDMDYLRSCDEILAKFDAVASELASEYGPLPVIGLGHSCGSLLQTLITCLFPDAPRAINILISFNNKPVSSAIPAFEELVVPLSQQIMGDGERGAGLREAVGIARTAIDQAIDAFAASSLAPGFVTKDLIPLFKQGIEIADQVPPLLKIIADGQREFEPTPADTKEVCRRMYRARRTLLIKFENDALDESEEIEKVLREANTIMRMKRPMVEMEVDLRVMTGTHITPLTQNIILDAPKNVPFIQPLVDINEQLLSSQRDQLRENFLETVNQVKSEILTFLDASIVRG
mmetsp:Transcript_27840/g.26671  ORF Transcript_27840/g.26671 Transcript_27840/m.26671 type:complete len:423 (+) Transcript_27840:62-1330(+)